MPSPTGRRLIFEGEDVRVRGVIVREDGPLVFTFSARRRGRQQTVGYGEALFEARGINAVHFVHTRNHWWHTAEMLPAIAAAQELRRALAPQRVLTYGYSMGGFGALLFASRLSAGTALAFSPQASLFRDDLLYEATWKEDIGDTREMYRLTGDCMAGCDVMVCYDPLYDIDITHVAAIRALHPVTAIRMPFAGHRTPNYLREVDRLSRAVVGIVDGSADWRAVRREVRATRDSSTVYFGRLLRQRPSLADRVAPRLDGLILARLGSDSPRPPDQRTGEAWLERTAPMLLHDGGAEIALARAESLARAFPESGRAAFVRATILVRMGRFAAAEDILTPLLRAQPRDVRRRLLQATILMATHRTAAAEAVIAGCLAHGRTRDAGWRPAPAAAWRGAALAAVRHGLSPRCRRAVLDHAAALLPQDGEIAAARRAARLWRIANILHVLRKPAALFGR